MREILFRGKRTDNGEWVEGFLAPIYMVSRNDNTEMEFAIIDANKIGDVNLIYGTKCIGGTPANYHINPETVGEYTGKVDKNGKKIFEGDILKVKFRNTDTLCVVAFRECRFISISNGWVCKFRNMLDVEVIGNIYDNVVLQRKRT